jgi:hypothetical protein
MIDGTPLAHPDLPRRTASLKGAEDRMANYEDDETVRELVRARDSAEGTDGRDPGEVLEGAIILWCYFLKLEADPLAYRSAPPNRSGSRGAGLAGKVPPHRTGQAA